MWDFLIKINKNLVTAIPAMMIAGFFFGISVDQSLLTQLKPLGVLGTVFAAIALKSKQVYANPAIVGAIFVPLLIIYSVNFLAGTMAGRLFSQRGDAISYIIQGQSAAWYVKFDDLVKSLFSPQSTQRSQRKYFYFQQVISVGFVLSVVDFQFLRIHQIYRYYFWTAS